MTQWTFDPVTDEELSVLQGLNGEWRITDGADGGRRFRPGWSDVEPVSQSLCNKGYITYLGDESLSSTWTPPVLTTKGRAFLDSLKQAADAA